MRSLFSVFLVSALIGLSACHDSDDTDYNSYLEFTELMENEEKRVHVQLIADCEADGFSLDNCVRTWECLWPVMEEVVVSNDYAWSDLGLRPGSEPGVLERNRALSGGNSYFYPLWLYINPNQHRLLLQCQEEEEERLRKELEDEVLWQREIYGDDQ